MLIHAAILILCSLCRSEVLQTTRLAWLEQPCAALWKQSCDSPYYNSGSNPGNMCSSLLVFFPWFAIGGLGWPVAMPGHTASAPAPAPRGEQVPAERRGLAARGNPAPGRWAAAAICISGTAGPGPRWSLGLRARACW